MWACHFDRYENMELLLNISHEDEMRFEVIDAELKDKDRNGKNLLHWSVSSTTSKECFKVVLQFHRAVTEWRVEVLDSYPSGQRFEHKGG